MRNCFYCVKDHTSVQWGTCSISFKAQLTVFSVGFTIFYVLILRLKNLSVIVHINVWEEIKLCCVKLYSYISRNTKENDAAI